jgi:hypothetical protein
MVILVAGNTFLDIREFYGVDGDEKPGKKGISLTIEQVSSENRLMDITQIPCSGMP